MPPTLDDGWAIANPSEVGLDATRLSQLDKFLKQWRQNNVHAVVIVRRGKLVFERYFRGRERRVMEWSEPVEFSPTKKHDIRSISKSVTSLLIGVAISEDRFPALDLPVIDYFPEYADLRTPKNGRITFRHLLTMSHGLRWDESRAWKSRANNERQMLEAKDPCRYVLEQPMALPPGASFNYSGGATTLLGAALAKGVRKTLDFYAREKLFEPLGITDVEWLGFSNRAEVAAFFGLRLRPRDLAKLGQLVADDGRWNHTQVVPASWIVESTKPHVNAEGPGALYYGYQWWLWPFFAERSRIHLDRRLRQWRPTPFHRTRARSRYRRQRFQLQTFHPDRHSQPVRYARRGRLSVPLRITGWNRPDVRSGSF